ncbi:pyridoxine 5'-phosphate synthase [Agaribacterium haliotis]|uniref:pyridoxine 5'-phosphate synthase n=1 Tax=Agaribacterium haliotis TaxID=2013869 RepID=UPI000BB539A0|nr:pyridoxine 5'-phosphate synthase [Agaribacterium haliotis]
MSGTLALSVNLNKVALLRNARTDNNPDLLDFADIALDAGAAGLTAHPRPDQRHIRASDILPLATKARERGVEFNMEGNPFCEALGDYPGFLELVRGAKPAQCTLVPDANNQLTSDHGFNLNKDGGKLEPIIAELKQLGCRVSLFMDPDLDQIGLAAGVGADRIELYTGPYALAFSQSSSAADAVFKQHCDAAEHAHSLGLGINAGHDLNLANLKQYCRLPKLAEVSIGHALTADALRMGFAGAVRAYADICAETGIDAVLTNG